MSYGRDKYGYEEPKHCSNCKWFFNGSGHFQVKNKNGIQLPEPSKLRVPDTDLQAVMRLTLVTH